MLPLHSLCGSERAKARLNVAGHERILEGRQSGAPDVQTKARPAFGRLSAELEPGRFCREQRPAIARIWSAARRRRAKTGGMIAVRKKRPTTRRRPREATQTAAKARSRTSEHTRSAKRDFCRPPRSSAYHFLLRFSPSVPVI